MSSNTNIGNTPVNQGYVQLIHTGETGGIDGTLRTLYDGDGTASDLQIASNKVKISTELFIGSKTITEFVQDVVGDMFTTGSYTNITTTYDDTNGNIDLNASGDVTLSNTVTLSNKTLAAPTLTGTTQGASITLSGDLTVNGTTTTVNQTNLDVSDNIIGLNRGAGSNANDSGLIIERGSTGDNAAIIWDESADKFTLGTTTSTPSATGNLTISTGTLVATIEGNVTGNVTGSASLNLLKSSNLSDLESASTARSNLGVDAAGTDNSTNVTLAGSLDYITLSGQEITRNAINLTTDVTGTLPVGNGGTGLTSISTLLNSNVTPTSLGLVIGTNVLAQQTIGIANDNLVEIDDADAADNDYAKFTANGLEGRSFAEVRSDLGLGVLATASSVDFDRIDGSAYIASNESFSDSDLQLMTAKAINDRIESFGYGTGNGDMTGVSITASNPLDISQSNTTSGNYTATISLDATEFQSYLTDMTTLNLVADELLVIDSGDSTLKRKAISEIRLSLFDDTGFSSGISFDGSTANGVLTFKDSDEATVESNLTFDGSTLAVTGDLTVDDITINGSTISDSGNFTIDVGGDISLDSANGVFRLKDGGTEFAKISENSNNLRIFSTISDADILLQVNDGGVTTTAMTIDGATARVGIGTTSPAETLHLANGSGASQLRMGRSGDSTYLEMGAGTNYAVFNVENNATNAYDFQDGGTSRLMINASGAITFNNAYTFPTGIGSEKYILTAEGSNVSFFDYNSSTLTAVESGDKMLIIDVNDSNNLKIADAPVNVPNVSGTTANGVLTYNSTGGGGSVNVTTESALTFDGTLLHISKETSTTGTTGTTLLKLTNDVGGDLSQQKTFIDFALLDSNSNETPQVRIGAEVGQNADANSLEREGSGAFVVYTNNADTGSGDAGASLAERMRVDYQGRVGIGVTDPSMKLEVAGHTRISSVGSGLFFDTTGSEASNYIKTINDFETLIANGRGSAGFGVIGNQSIRFGFGNNFSNAETDLFINNDGRIGIGSSSPGAKLDVDVAGSNGGIRVKSSSDSKIAHFRLAGGSRELLQIGGESDSVSKVQIGTSATSAPAITIDSSDKVGIGTSSPGHKLHVVGDRVAHQNDTGGFYRYNASGTFRAAFTDNNTTTQIFADGDGSNAAMTFNGGNVGIGVTAPTAKLHVSGEMKASVAQDNYAFAVENSTEPQFRYRIYNDGSTTGEPLTFRTGLYFNTTENATIHFYRGPSSLGGYMTFQTNNGNERMRIDSSGNVGIGTNSPSAKLDVRGNVSFFSSDASDFVSFTHSDNGIIINSAGSTSNKMFLRTGGSDALTIDASQNVGIGTSSPSSKLHIVEANLGNHIRLSHTESDNTRKFGAYLGSHYSNSEEPVTGMLIDSGSTSATGNLVTIGGGVSAANAANIIRFYTAANNTTLVGDERMRIDNSGNVGIGTTSPASPLEVNGNVAFGDTATGIKGTIHSTDEYRINALDVDENGFNSLHLRADGTDGLFIQKDTNRVGIGTSSPAEKLHIVGNVRVHDSGYLAAGDSNDIFLRHDGNGHLQSQTGQMYINNVATTNIIISVGNDEKVRIENDGDLHVKADVVAYSSTPSDIRLKKNFTKIDNGLDVISKLDGQTFNWKKDEGRLSAGFKAQEVEKVLPHLVDERELPLHSDDERDYKVLRYEEIIPYLVEAIKEQQEQINKLEEKLNG